jgi:hypothetical protein
MVRGLTSRTGWTVAIGLALALGPTVNGFSATTQGPAVVQLAGERPAWLTQSVFDRIVELGSEGLAYDFTTGQPVVPLPSQILLRPGVLLVLPSDLCTANFVYTDATHGLLIGTAGHCTVVGDSAIAISYPNLATAIGTTVSKGEGTDWALIDIDAAWEPHTDPTVALVTGPCGAYAGDLPSGTDERIVKYVGHGSDTGLVSDMPRIGHLLGLGNDSFSFDGIGSPGDSGAPVLLEPSPLATGTVPLTGSCGSGAALGILIGTTPLAGCRQLPPKDLGPCRILGTRVTAVPATVVDGAPLSGL